MTSAIRYTIFPKDPAAHLFEVSLIVDRPDPKGQLFALPAWIPGSYMIREFARNIVQIRALSDGKKIKLTKVDKHTWRAAHCNTANTALTLSYDVYAWDLSVRAAHLDQTHGFFNGPSVFLRVIGQEEMPHQVNIRRPEGAAYDAWRVATALPELAAKRYGFGTYLAANYDELIDHPVEMGSFALATFQAHGVQHDIVITGKVPNLDLPRLTTDLKKICEAHIAFFEPKTKRAPMKRYVFMTFVVGEGYGGLEHRASTALLCARSDLPVIGQKAMSDAYRAYLGLCSHEYFHTWNIKRIKPAAFVPYDLQAENYTSLLWLFEGFTSYYDDVMLVRSGVIDQAAYLKLVAQTINNVMRGSGRSKQSIADSSFDAWIKYYRQDENAPNAIVSYYTKGALVALALDLTIRAETKDKKSLDDVMRALWQRYGQNFYADSFASKQGVTEFDVEALFEEITGLKLRHFFLRYINGTDDPPLDKLLPQFGVRITAAEDRQDIKPSLGVRLAKNGKDCTLANVYEGGAAHRAGLSAGDVLVAVDGLRVLATNLDALLARYRIHDAVAVHVFRRDELMMFNVTLVREEMKQVSLTQ